MLFILLSDLTGVGVKLKDLLVGATSQEDVLLVVLRMKLDTERGLFVCETPDHLSSLCVPKLDDSVKPSTQKSSPIVAEANISYCL